jgi:hypothetical protein
LIRNNKSPESNPGFLLKKDAKLVASLFGFPYNSLHGSRTAGSYPTTTRRFKMEQIIKVTPANAILLQTCPWTIVNADRIVGMYRNRDEARASKKAGLITGSIVKTADLELEVVMPVAAKTQPAKDDGFARQNKKVEITHVSTIERPCKRVWDIAESMPGAKRKDILAACVAEGIAYYTARTQYQMLLSVRKEEAAREAAQAIKAAK